MRGKETKEGEYLLRKLFINRCLAVLLALALLTACSSRDLSSSEPEPESPSSSLPPVSESSGPEEESEPSEPDPEPETEPASEPASEPESSSEPEPPAQAEAPEPTAFNYSLSDVVKVYARSYSDFTYSPLDASRVEQVVGMLQRAGQAQSQEIFSRNEGGFFVVLADGEKYSYTLIPTAVRVGTESYPVNQEEYNTLLALANGAISAGPAHVQWLVFMRPDWIVSATFHPDSAAQPKEIPAANLLPMAGYMAGIQVKAGSGDSYSEVKTRAKTDGNAVIRLNFDGGIYYSIFLENGMLYIESSDMDYGCKYQLTTSEASILAAMNGYL